VHHAQKGEKMEDVFTKRVTGIMIHAFAIAHGIAAAALAQTVVGDDAVLTLLTTGMIISVTMINGRSKDIGTGLAVAGCLAGFFLGTRGAMFIIKWIPAAGNVANSITTMIVTEILGWAAYLIVRDNANAKNMKWKDKIKYMKKAYHTYQTEKKVSEQLYESMSREDKDEVTDIIKKLGEKGVSENEVKALNQRLEAIVHKYA